MIDNVRTICGVGINDADYVVNKYKGIIAEDGNKKWVVVSRCPFYVVWKSMLNRGYDEKTKQKQPTYYDSSVCKEWHLFSTFKAWMETQDWQGKHLDKDILVPGNKIYSPETCIFVSRRLNSFVTDNAAARGEWPIGMHWNKKAGKFMAQCSNPLTGKNEYLGYFTTPEDAFEAWRARKLENVLKLAAVENLQDNIVEALINRYKNMVTPNVVLEN